jgi:hypothetical protein
MRTFITILGASTILLGSLALSDPSANAKAKLQLTCKHYLVEGPGFSAMFKAQAQTMARQLWQQKVTQTIGSHWADHLKAKNKDYVCVPLKKVTCKLVARPCRQVSTFSASSVPPAVFNPGFSMARPSRQLRRRP